MWIISVFWGVSVRAEQTKATASLEQGLCLLVDTMGTAPQPEMSGDGGEGKAAEER